MRRLQQQNFTATAQNRNQTLDVLKGICILMVIFTHFTWTADERLSLCFPLWIDMAVPIFMLISGYVNALSYQRKNITSLKQSFTIKNLLRPFIRYTLPFLIIYILEVIFHLVSGAVTGDAMTWQQYLLGLVTGGWGAGSYYYPVMLQFILMFPFIFLVIKKFKHNGLIICFLTNLFWEAIKFPLGVSSGLYRLLAFRYIFLIAFGCYISLFGYANKKVHILSISGALLGFLFIVLSQYTSYSPIIFTQWTATSLAAILFILPLFSAIVLNVNSIPKYLKPLAFIGKASYNIFFVQMALSYALAISVDIRILALIIEMVGCVGLGLLFYLIETPITKKVISAAYKRIK